MEDTPKTRQQLIEALADHRKRIFPGDKENDTEGVPWFRALDDDVQFRRLLELMGAVITEVDEQGTIIYVSSTVSSATGYTPEEMVGHPGETPIHTDDLEALIELQKNVSRTGKSKPTVFRSRHKDGRWIWIETSSATRFIVSDGTVHSLTFSRNVTDLKNAQDELIEAENRYRTIVESSNDVVLEANESGEVVFVTQNIEASLGYTPDDFVAMEPFAIIHPEDLPRVRDEFNKAVDELRAVHLAAYRVRHADGSLRWLESTGIGYCHTSGEIRFLNVTRDVTTALEDAQSRRELEDRMQQAQRLESLGVMAGGIAHDFNNLLTPILGDASLVLHDLAADSPIRHRLERIQATAQRAAELTRQMLAYAGAEEIETEPLDLSALVRETAQLLTSAVSGETEVLYELEQQLPSVLGERGQLIQVVMNLLTNAAEAMEGRDGKITMRTGTTDVARETIFEIPERALPPGSYVFLEVEDSGCGMDPETRRRIFDPFFTTKFTGRGLGLASVLGILRAHRGAVEIETAPGWGTRLRVLFPRAESQHEPEHDRARGSDTTRSRNEAILVIDDDEGALEVTADCLAFAGFQVFTASDGWEGLELYHKNRDKIELVILDRTMPHISGEETFDRIRIVESNAKILLMSGYAEKRASESFKGKNLSGFIHKPFLPEELIDKVRALILDSKR